MAEGDDPQPAARPSIVRSLALVAVGAAVASAIFWIAGRPRAPARQQAVITTAKGYGPKAPRHPDLPAPSKGPGDQRLAGVVVDGAGAAVGGVHVTAELEKGQGPAAAKDLAIVAVADARGAFTLEGMTGGRYRLRVEGPDVFTGELRFVPVPSDEVRVVVARKVRVEGKVLDGNAPVAAAEVDLVGDAISGTLTVTTDKAGAFAFPDLPEGSYQVWAVSGDLAARAQRALRLGAGPFPGLELRLESAAIVVGRVVAKGTQTPVVAELVLRPGEGAVDEPPRFARTDSDGAFRVPGIPHGRWTAEAYAPGMIAAGSLAFEAGRAPLVLELEPGGQIEGTILDGAGRPIAGAEVSAAAGERLVSAVTEDDRLRELAGLGHAPTAAPSSPDSDPRFLPRGELGVLLGPIPFPPPPGASAARAAQIIDSGASATVLAGSIAPPPSVPLPVDPARAPIWVTGADGRYRIPGLDAGTWTVIARAPDYAEGKSRPTTITRDQTLTVDLTLSPGVFVVGTVTDGHGEPVITATITIESGAAGAQPLTGITDDTGAYRLGPVAGDVRVRASAYGHVDAEREVSLGAPRDSAREERIDLVLAAADGAIEGELDDPTGLPVASAQLTVIGKDTAARHALTDGAGRFRIAGLPPGAVRLHVEAPGFPPQDLASTTADDVRLQLVLGGGLDGLVFDHHTGQPIPGAAISATGPGARKQDAESGGDGRFTIAPIAAGAWRLRVALAGYLPVVRTIDVPAGDRPGAITARDQRFELERGATLGGIVRDRYGSRLPDAKVTVRRRGGADGDEATATARTDADGAFRITDTPTGDLEVTVDRDALHGGATLTLRPGDEYLSLQLEAQ